MGMNRMIRAGILTVSDRSSKGLRKDSSGPLLKKMLEEKNWEVQAERIVPDERAEIRKVLLEWCDVHMLSLILTTGGTGIGPRDITPETTSEILDKELRGFSELMRQEGLKHTPLAVLSRSVAGVRGQSLIINLPGSPKGSRESLLAVIDVIPHAIMMIQGQDHDSKTESVLS